MRIIYRTIYSANFFNPAFDFFNTNQNICITPPPRVSKRDYIFNKLTFIFL